MSCEELKPEEQSMVAVAWEITHSVETNVSPAFAWNYWTEVTNWDDPPAKFELGGPFACGSRGTTRLPGQEPLHWFIREVNPPHAATIEMQLEVGLTDGRTRLTQRVVLKGEKADMYLSQVKAAFTANLPDGMNKLATAMANADPNRKRPTPC